MDKIGVVLLNYKTKKSLIACLKSVLKSSYKNIKIFVVDNSSDEYIETMLPRHIDFIQNDHNLGYSGGNNIGIKQALVTGCEKVLILNPDTLIRSDTVKLLSEKMDYFEADVVGPKIYFFPPDGQETIRKIWYAGGIFNQADVLGSHRGVDEIDQGQYDKAGKTDFVTGAALMVRKNVFEKIGLFDERYFLYYEDADFCYRAKQAGFKIMYIPDAVVFHENAKSTVLGSPLQDYYITRNRLLFANKFLSLRTRVALIKEVLLHFSIPTRRKALIDFFLNKFGKGNL